MNCASVGRYLHVWANACMCIIMCMHDLYAYVHVIDVISSTLTFIIFKECIFVCVCVGGGGGGLCQREKECSA